MTQKAAVGVQLFPQATTVDSLRRAWGVLDEAGVDAVYLWDHFFPFGEIPAPRIWSATRCWPRWLSIRCGSGSERW